MIYDAKDNPVTEERWWLVEQAISAFIQKYPLHWMQFQRDLKAERTQYQLGTGDLAKSSFRNTLSFPIILRKATMVEFEVGLADEDGLIEVDSLLPVLEKILPGLLKSDKGGDNKLYREFIRRFKSILLAGESF